MHKEKTLTPDSLLRKAKAYFKWCDTHPWHRHELLKSGVLAGTLVEVPVQRPYTMVGLCVYVGISEEQFCSYQLQEHWQYACTHIKQTIRRQQLEGATVGLYSAGVVASMQNTIGKEAYAESSSTGKFEVAIVRAD